MATKKSAASELSNLEAKQDKAKRKSVHKKKFEADLSALPNAAEAPDIDSVAKPLPADALHGKISAHEHPALGRDMMRDIKPREFHRDAAFLVPEKFGFDLKLKDESQFKSGWAKKFIYTIIAIIVVLFAGLMLMNRYSNKLADTSPANVAINDNSQNTGNAGAESPAAYTLALTDFSADMKMPLTALLNSNYKTNFNIVANAATLPTATADTLFVKRSDSAQNTDLLNFLAANGIKAQIMQVNDLPTDAALYLTDTVAAPDLSGSTSAVYNATGTSGLAKKTCDVLLKYKATSCNALNASAKAKGTIVNYKDQKIIFTLKRTLEFKTANFAPAASNQVEDIRVTLGN